MNDAMKKFPIIYETPVAWGEMDALGHVNNIIYFRYFECARAKYFDAMGVWDYIKSHGIGMILHSTACRFRKPISYPDKVSVGTRTTEVAEDRFVMEYAVYSHTMQAIAAEGSGIIVVYDYNKNQKCPMPKELKEAIERIENITIP
ncbi:acyl-CoA thioesterase [bacterium]|nr:acyl-CoA thioesterase [bacterium]